MSDSTPSDRILIVIPSYNPNFLLVDTIKDLNSFDKTKNLKKIVVNDGSERGLEFYSEILKQPQITVLRHSKNLGKGTAIKTGIQHVLDQEPTVQWLITVDSDGQHKGRDVCALIDDITDDPLRAQIGVRLLSSKDTPIRSYIGNLFMRKIFFLLYRFELKDTQSGLRVYPRNAFDLMLKLKSLRYDFEMDAITVLLLNKFHFHQTPISTIYLNKNSSSHFKPITDSVKVVWILFKNRFNF